MDVSPNPVVPALLSAVIDRIVDEARAAGRQLDPAAEARGIRTAFPNTFVTEQLVAELLSGAIVASDRLVHEPPMSAGPVG